VLQARISTIARYCFLPNMPFSVAGKITIVTALREYYVSETLTSKQTKENQRHQLCLRKAPG
jgi:hypothetical protein